MFLLRREPRELLFSYRRKLIFSFLKKRRLAGLADLCLFIENMVLPRENPHLLVFWGVINTRC